MLEGQLEWRVGPDLEPRAGSAGSFVSVPPDVLHTFHNPGPGDTRFLNLHAPGLGFERYLRGDFPEFDQHYLPEGSGLDADRRDRARPGRGRAAPARRARRRRSRSAASSSAVFEAEIGPDFPHPPAHRHPATVEGFYVLEGEFGLLLDGEEARVPADGCAAVPPGTIHTSPPSTGPLRYLNVFAPGGMERYLREAVRLGAPPPPDEFDIEFV